MVKIKKMATLIATLTMVQSAVAVGSTPYSETFVNESYHNSVASVSSSSEGLEQLYSLVHQFMDFVAGGDGDSPLGLNSELLFGDPEEELPLQLQLQLRAQLSEHWEDNKTQGCGQSKFKFLFHDWNLGHCCGELDLQLCASNVHGL